MSVFLEPLEHRKEEWRASMTHHTCISEHTTPPFLLKCPATFRGGLQNNSRTLSVWSTRWTGSPCSYSSWVLLKILWYGLLMLWDSELVAGHLYLLFLLSCLPSNQEHRRAWMNAEWGMVGLQGITLKGKIISCHFEILWNQTLSLRSLNSIVVVEPFYLTDF